MGLLDDLLKQASGASRQPQPQGGGGGGLADIVGIVTKNPQVLSAVVSLLSSRDASVGGSGGLGGLVQMFQKKGLGEMMSSWISTGPNPAISPKQLTDVLGNDTLKQFAAKAGVPEKDAGGLLASVLPAVIDHVTPEGKVPESNTLESSLGGLLSGLLK